jgi:hypothetical protein
VNVYGGGGEMDYGVVTGRLTEGPMTPRVQIETQFVTALLGDAALDEEDVE